MIVKLREMERRTVWVVQRDLEFVPRATEKKKKKSPNIFQELM